MGFRGVVLVRGELADCGMLVVGVGWLGQPVAGFVALGVVEFYWQRDVEHV